MRARSFVNPGIGAVLLCTGIAGAQVVDHHIPLNYNFHGMAHSAAITGISDEWTATANNVNADLPNGYRGIADRGLIFDAANNRSLAFYSGLPIGATGGSYRFFNTLGYANTTGANPSLNGLDIVHLGSRCSGFAPATIFAYEGVADGVSNVGIAPDWNVCDHSNAAPQTTTLATPIVLDATAEIGVLYHSSSGSGTAPQFDVVLGFSDHAPVTVRLAAPDWYGIPPNPAILANQPVSVQQKLAHVVGPTTFQSFQGADNNDAPVIKAVTTGVGPNLNVMEGIISIPRIVSGIGTFPADPTIVGKTLTSITFQSANYPVGGGRGYAIFAATVRTGTAANSICSGATQIPALTAGVVDVPSNNVHNFAAEVSTCGGGNDMTSAWFKYTTVVGGGQMKASTCTASIDTTITVYTGSCGSLTEVGCNDNTTGCGTGGIGATVTWIGAPSTTYYIRVAGKNNAVGTFTLHFEDLAPPVNNTCSGALPISAGSSALSNAFSFGSTPTACGGGNDTTAVWYAYTAATTGVVEARTCLDPPTNIGTGAVPTLPFDTTLAVYSSCGGSALACNDNGCSQSSRIQWNATIGNMYFIRVAGKNAITGNFTLTIADPAPIDIPMPLQFNWNGICHGPTEQTLPSGTGAGHGSTHENRSDLNGYRSVADRGLLCDGVSVEALNYGGTSGYQGMAYTIYSTTLQSDMVHLGNRNQAAGGIRAFSLPGTVWPAQGGTATSNNGLSPLWLSSPDHTGPQISSMTSLNAVFGPDTQVGVLYHMANGGSSYGSFDVTLFFTDNSSVTVSIDATDWFGNNATAMPAARPGVVIQRKMGGPYRGVQNTDRADDAGSGGRLWVDEAVISTSSLISGQAFDPTGKTLDSIIFSNPRSTPMGTGSPTESGIGIFAATLRNPASFNLNFGPSGTGTVTPNQILLGGTGLMTVTVSRGTGSPNNITSVSVDASSIGLGTVNLNDSGANGDVTPNDNVWSFTVSFPLNTFPGAASLPFTVTDAQARTAMGNIIFSVVPLNNALLTPDPILAGTSGVATLNLTGIANLTSVQADGSSMGLGNINFNDSGTGGDAMAADGIWSATVNVPALSPGGPYNFGITVQNASLQAAFSNLPFTVQEPTGACCIGGNAQILTLIQCTNQAGDFLGHGTSVLGVGTPFTSGDSFPIAIPDFNVTPGTASSTITIGDSTTITGLAIRVGLTHTFVGDLIGTLSNGVTTVTLFNRVGGLTDLAGVYRFADAAPTAFGTGASPLAPGDYAPAGVGAGPISVFNGQSIAGTWTLTVTDNAGVDVGTIDSFVIELNPTPCPVQGACCNGTVCTIVNSGACGGTYQGDNSTCTPDPCGTPVNGACCCGAHCSVTTSAACPTGTGTNSTWTAGQSCTPFSNTAPCCRGDYNKSGGNPSVQDIFDFLGGYFGNSTCADANDSGGLPSVQDIFDFLAAYFGGGCV